MVDYTKKTWDSLSSVKAAIERDKSEKIISFDGIELITDKSTYRLCSGILRRL
jgi:hypothetical protein